MHNSDYPSHSQSPQPRKRHRVRNILLGVAGAFVLLIILVAVFSHPKPPAASSAPAAQSAAPASTQPAAAQPVQPAATTAPPAPVTVGRFTGSGDYNSPPFTLNGNPVTVTYSYSGNIMAGETTGDNFMAALQSSGDDQSIVNDIGTSGGTTTTLYPNTSFGGSTSYHLSVTASGSWSFTIAETP